jgi:hypothetical protein
VIFLVGLAALRETSLANHQVNPGGRQIATAVIAASNATVILLIPKAA